ncbi:phosphoglycerate mutase [Yeosuana aromativorans]|uniref:Phosphoglycerate mutase n=1 Tax=Yeosuana aromativorans TaxID=288019 RepID=A0A8J3BLG3_9FLAO|nr:histidine phosphatase family protein [Yeosuana aromativorans]GGK30133.1 phosphoglycerate mutase [Yeosuana aromativorans]
MKKLILIRHAKSSWEQNLSDHNRPLSSRGFKDAENVSRELLGQLKPNLVLSSDALRAKTTAEIFISTLGISHEIFVLNHDLYDFSGNNLLSVIKNTSKSINELLVFGHNNAITFFVNTYGNQYIDNVPTCGVAVIEFDIDNWTDLKKGRTIKTVYPKGLL